MIEEIVEAGPDRQEADCQYYDRCGGCQLQHLRYEAQLGVKAGIVTDCLTRIGGVDAPVVFVDASPREWGYRNRVSFVIRSTAESLAAGFHARDNADDIIDVERCPLAEDVINGVWQRVRAIFSGRSAPLRYDLRVTIRATAGGDVGIAIETRQRPDDAVIDELAAVENVRAIWWIDPRTGLTAHKGAESITEHRGPYSVALSGTAFLQVNRKAAELLDAYVVGQCSGRRGRHIIDAYSGFGLRALDLSRNGAVVTGIDIDDYSVNTAISLSVSTGIAAAFISGPVERVMPGHLPADIVVMNPPRKGVDRRAIDALLSKPAQRIVYVSCNPATLARDLKLLSEKYAVTACRAFDLFPQTAHVETVITLERNDQ